jgi:L-ribulose-5-phosphate 3-epimerase
MNPIGIRQGRLSPSSIGRVQRFPHGTWKDEFVRARDCGLACIDWLLPADDWEQNPIWSRSGQDDIRAAIAATGVTVPSLCADYFIAHPFVRVSAEERGDSERMLARLIRESARAGVRIVVVPLLEAAEIQTSFDMTAVRTSLDEALDLAATLGVTVAVEADMPGSALESLMELDRHPALGICYDTGNAALRGFDVNADLARLRSDIVLVHVKDRDGDGVSVSLGSGLVDFSQFFRASTEIHYAGPMVLETPRSADPVDAARANLTFLRKQAVSTEAAGLGSRTGR